MLALGLGEQVPAKHDVGAKKIMVENYQEFYPEPHLEPIDWEWIKEEAAKLQN